MASQYMLQIVHVSTGVIVAWTPRKPETDGPLIDDLCARLEARMALLATDLAERIRAKGVGFMRTEAHVIADVHATCDEMNLETSEVLRQVWQEMLHELKAQV